MSKEKRSCYSCKYQTTCFLRRVVYDAIMPQAATFLVDAPKPWMTIFDALAMICAQYVKEEDIET